MESQRVEGKPHPVPKTIAYLGNRDAAIARLEAMTIPNKERLIAQVRAATPSVGKNQGKRGRPKQNPLVVQKSLEKLAVARVSIRQG